MWFGYSGRLLWQLGLLMAQCKIGGSLVGKQLGLKHRSACVRALLLVVVSSLNVKAAFDAVVRVSS
jgi:uncharacterized membrane protein YfcA